MRPDSPAAVLKEGRWLAPAPRIPATREDWLALPGRLDDFLKDHFGLRQAMIRAHKDLTKPLLGLGNNSVLVGRDGRMFYLGEDMVRQSAGLVLRDQAVSDTTELLAQVERGSGAPRDSLSRRRRRQIRRRSISTICRTGRRTGASRPNTICLSINSPRSAF